jgi:hypothetical protein
VVVIELVDFLDFANIAAIKRVLPRGDNIEPLLPEDDHYAFGEHLEAKENDDINSVNPLSFTGTE